MPPFYHNMFCLEYRIGGVWHVAYLNSNKLASVMRYLEILVRNAIKWHVDKILVSDHQGRPALAYPLT